MAYKLYLVESSIDKFFFQNTREQCDEFDALIAGGEPVTPVPIQGSSSYIVTAGPKQTFVRFRAHHSKSVHMGLAAFARKINGSITPECVYQRTIGEPSVPLPVYTMKKLPGVPCVGFGPIEPQSTRITQGQWILPRTLLV